MQLVKKTFLGEDILAPFVSLNGTSRAELVKQYSDAQMATVRALVGVREAAPHMRDYQGYPEPSDAYRTAMRQHMARVSVLESLGAEFNTLAHIVMESERN